MENNSEKFYLYLLNKKENFLNKSDIERYFEEFSNQLNLKVSFENIFQTLKQQRKVVFMFNKVWKVLDEEEWFKLKKGKIEKIDILITYLNHLNVKWYFGLSSAKYYLGNWQSLNKIYLINTNFNKVLKFDNLEINLLKIPEKYFIDKSIITLENKNISDFEKTYLDEVYFYLKGKYKNPLFGSQNINFNTLNLYLRVFDDFKDLRISILNNLEKEDLKKID